MKKIVFLSYLVLFLACNDGDLQIETINFDDANPQTCEALIAEDSEGYVVFKINDDEALIVELPSTAFKNEVGEEITLAVALTGSTKVTYRIFDESVTSDYFCSNVPVGSPQVTEEVPAKDGEIFISTSTEDDITFTHSITLSAISLETGTGQRITDLRISKFGVVTTTIPTETQ